jgi:hypothetical protein
MHDLGDVDLIPPCPKGCVACPLSGGDTYAFPRGITSGVPNRTPTRGREPRHRQENVSRFEWAKHGSTCGFAAYRIRQVAHRSRTNRYKLRPPGSVNFDVGAVAPIGMEMRSRQARRRRPTGKLHLLRRYARSVTKTAWKPTRGSGEDSTQHRSFTRNEGSPVRVRASASQIYRDFLSVARNSSQYVRTPYEHERLVAPRSARVRVPPAP